jgi:antitoxin MazE
MTGFYDGYILWIENNGEIMFTTHIKKWGDSLAIRLPQSLLTHLDVKEDCEIEISIDEGRLILSPVKKPKYTLDELLAKVTPDSLHDEIEFGAPPGKEVL